MDTITATAAPGPRAKKPGLFINQDFALLFTGGAVSFTGDILFTFTLTIWIALGLAKGQTWAPLAVSGVLLAASVPVFLFGPFAGVFVDRAANKRRMMLWMDGLRALAVALMTLIAGDIPLPFIPGGKLPVFWSLGVIYAVVFFIYAAEQLFRPASMAMLQAIVPEAQQAKAMGLFQSSIALASIIGPAAAAPLYAGFGPKWALIGNAVSFAISYLAILAVRSTGAPQPTVAGADTSPGTSARGGFLGEFLEGVRFYFSNRVLVTLLVAIVVAISGASALNALDVFFTTQNLGASTVAYGLIGAVYGAGAIVGSIVLAMVAERIGLARLLWTSMAGMGLTVMALSRLTAIGPAIALMLIIGFLNSALNVAASPLMLRVTPPNFMGRVMSIFQPVMNLAIVASTAAIGYLASVTLRGFHMTWWGMRFGPVDTIWLAGGAIMALSALVIVVGLWGVDKKSQASQAPQAAQAAQTDPVAPDTGRETAEPATVA